VVGRGLSAAALALWATAALAQIGGAGGSGNPKLPVWSNGTSVFECGRVTADGGGVAVTKSGSYCTLTAGSSVLLDNAGMVGNAADFEAIVDLAGKTLITPNGTADRSASCTAGSLYLETDDTGTSITGASICRTTDTWAWLGDIVSGGLSGGQTIKGGTASTDHLDLYSNTQSFASANTGRVRALERVVLLPSVSTFPNGNLLSYSSTASTAESTAFGALSVAPTATVAHLLLGSGISFAGTWTNNGASGGIMNWFSTGATLSNAAATTNTPIAPTVLTMGDVVQSVDNNVGAIASWYGVNDARSLRANTNADAAITVTDFSTVRSAPTITDANSGTATITTRRVIDAQNVTRSGTTTPVLTNNVPIDIAEQTMTAGGLTAGVRSAITSGTGKWFLLDTGGAASALTGKLQLGNSTAPTNDLGFDGASARTLGLDRHTTSNTAGVNFTVQGGGATSGATDKASGDLILATGLSTGTGDSKVRIQSATRATATGTSDNTLHDRIYIDSGKIVTNNSATALVDMILGTSLMGSAVIDIGVESKNASDFQSRTITLNLAGVDKGGAMTCGFSGPGGDATITEADSAGALSTGTMTLAFTFAGSSTNCRLSITANSSLSSISTGYPRVTWQLRDNSGAATTYTPQ
jgi:hypothetical protein